MRGIKVTLISLVIALCAIFSCGIIFNSSEQVANASGGIYVEGGANFEATGGVITGNTNVGITVVSGEYTIDGARFSGNTNGAIKVESGATLTLKNSIIENNTNIGNGGAIFVEENASLFIENCTFTNNIALSGNGGAIYVSRGAGVSISATTFERNLANVDEEDNFGYGGAIYVEDSAGYVSIWSASANNEFIGNQSIKNGGAIYVGKDVMCDISKCNFTENASSDGNGGAVYISGKSQSGYQSLYMQGLANTMEGNTAYENGGALYIEECASCTIEGYTFTENASTGGNGGAIYIADKTNFTMTGSENVMEGNSAELGGAVYVAGTESVYTNDVSWQDNVSTKDENVWQNIYFEYVKVLKWLDTGEEYLNEGAFIESTAYLREYSISTSDYWYTENIYFKDWISVGLTFDTLKSEHIEGKQTFSIYGLTKITVSSSGVVSARSTGISGQVIIPKVANGISLVSIAQQGFANCDGITECTIYEGVTSINVSAFSDCDKLIKLFIPSSVITINVHNSSDNICDNSTALESIIVDENNMYYSSFNSNCIVRLSGMKLMTGCKTTIIPEGVKIIGKRAFYGCNDLKIVTIPDTVTTIDDSAFDCTGIKTLNLNEGIERIGKRAFYAIDITTLTLPNTVKAIGDNAFSRCDYETFTLPASVTSLGINPFNCCDLSTIKSNNSKYQVLSDCLVDVETNTVITGSNKLTIPSSAEIIGAYAFSNMGIPSGYTILTIPKNVKTIGEYAFNSSTWYEIQQINFESGSVLEKIERYAFSTNRAVTSITIPASVVYMFGAFDRCSNLTSVVFEDTTSTWTTYYNASLSKEADIEDLSNPTQNALYLTDPYDYYGSSIWKKNT